MSIDMILAIGFLFVNFCAKCLPDVVICCKPTACQSNRERMTQTTVKAYTHTHIPIHVYEMGFFFNL